MGLNLDLVLLLHIGHCKLQNYLSVNACYSVILRFRVHMVKLYDLKRICTVYTVINKIRKPFVIVCDYT